MRLRQSPIAVLLLVPAGVLAGHALGYAGAHELHGGAAATAAHSHGYLVAAWAVATLLAGVALTTAGAGAAGPTAVPFRRLVALQWSVLLVQEGAEHALAGEPVTTLLASPALWLSLVFQLAAAAGAVLLVRTAGAVGLRLTASLRWSAPFVLPGRRLVAPLAAGGHGDRLVRAPAQRGPPLLSV